MSGKESPAHVLDEPQSALATRDHRRELISRMPVVERYFEFDSISTAVLEGGEGPPVVLLHGPSAYAAHWTDVISRLIATHRVIAPDLPGHGETRVTEGVLDVDRVLTWLARISHAI